MKRCPTCQRTFTDPNLSFCVDDGSPLRFVEEGEETTVVSPSGQGSPDAQWGAIAYKPPVTNMPPENPKKRIWPWVLGGGIVVLLLAGIGIGAAVFLPKMVKEQREKREAESRERNANSNQTPSDVGSANTNKAEETVNTPAPTDKELVLAQLTQLENEWTVANINADKKKLELILADDYVGPVGLDPNGPTQGKDEYIRNARRDTDTERWEFKDLQLTLRGERATLIGKAEFIAKGKVELYTFVDRFVWRNGRWQATGSVLTRATET